MDKEILELIIGGYMMAMVGAIALGFIFIKLLDFKKPTFPGFKKEIKEWAGAFIFGFLFLGVIIVCVIGWPIIAVIIITDELKKRGFFSKVG